jgi:16S rRNA (guanine1207-N2)-methyltransferase
VKPSPAERGGCAFDSEDTDALSNENAAEAGPAYVYGAPLPALIPVPRDSIQVSPLFPGSTPQEDLPAGAAAAFALAAPAGAVERRYALALALRALAPGGRLDAVAPKDRGGMRLRGELEAFGCTVAEVGRRHQRLCSTLRPPDLREIDAAIEAGGPRLIPQLGLWSQPGVFSWDRADPGSQLLLSVLPALEGEGADLGCGNGLLSRAVLASPQVRRLDLVELDRRAVEMARRNVVDTRAAFHWTDARLASDMASLDFVVSNPPFHDGGTEDKSLGQAFIQQAHAMLRRGGRLWIVANRHLPYEAVLADLFTRVRLVVDNGRYKVYEATR